MELSKAMTASSTVDSQLGQGAVFTIYLPAAQCTNSPETPASREDHLPKAQSPTSQHILYLDDDEAVLFIAALLERRGYRVSCFDDCQQALESLRSSPEDFDLIITDYNMPGMQGLRSHAKCEKSARIFPS